MAASARTQLLRALPGVDELLRHPQIAALVASQGRAAVTAAVRAVLAHLRDEISAGMSEQSAQLALSEIPAAVTEELERALRPSLRPVINATGVILHTNLGRAPLAKAALERMAAVAGGYSNLEFELESGRRGKRDVHSANLFDALFERQLGKAAQKFSTIVVNNNAAAVLLALNTLAEGGEAIVSRGELVEIGGSFRIPEVMAKAGVRLREVGTTNRTRLADFERAIGKETRLLLRVHHSNFRMSGFTERPAIAELAKPARRRRLPLVEDLGSGALCDLRGFGIEGEPGVAASLRAGADVVTYSGDKLLGGPQAGILTGKKALIARMRTNQLFRALRVDKLTYVALAATLGAYLRQDFDAIPALRMMRLREGEIRARAEALTAALGSATRLRCTVIAGKSVIGGGAAPGATLPTALVAVSCEGISAAELAGKLRRAKPLPIIARIESGQVILDLRTVAPEQDADIEAALGAIANHSPRRHGDMGSDL